MLQSVLMIAAVVYAAIVVFAFVFADRALFQPPAGTYDATRLPVVLVKSADDSVAVLHLPNPTARYTILFSHGNAEDLGSVSYTLHDLHALGFDVYGYDYRGYGMSRGGPASEKKAQDDAQAVYDHIVQVMRVSPERLILHGRSVGTGPTMYLASRVKAAGVILESPFVSAFRVVTGVRILPFDRFPNLQRMAQLKTPVLIMHGGRDEVIPFKHGLRMYAAAQGPKQALWVEEASHNDFAEVAGRRYGDALKSFEALLDRRALND